MKQRIRSLFIYLAVVSCLLSSVSLAQDEDYSVDIAVSNQSQSEYRSAVRIGLESLIGRLSGNRAVLQRPEVKEALGGADSFVEQYQYQPVNNPTSVLRKPSTPEVKKSGEAPFTLHLLYSREALQELLDSGARPVAAQSTVEESTMVWLVFEKSGLSELVGGDVHTDIQDRINQYASALGLNLVFPLMDLQDYQALTIADIRGGFEDKIRVASARYDTESIVSGIITEQSSDLWLSSWKRFAGGGNRSFSNTALNIDSVLGAGVDWVAQTAVSPAGADGTLRSASSTHIWVAHIDSTDRYTRVSRLLQDLPGVDAVSPSFLSAEGMVFSISPRLSVLQLQQQLNQIPWLRQSPPPEPEFGESSAPGNAELFFDYTG